MNKFDDDDHERRKQLALRRLRTNAPCCSTCPENRWQVLELHHVAGQAHDDILVIQCRNCHRVLSDAQRDHPPAQDSIDPSLEAIGRFLLGLADMLRLVAEKLIEFGRDLIERANQFNPIEGNIQ